MHLGNFTDFQSFPHVVLLSGSSDEFSSLRDHICMLAPDAALAIHELEGVTSVRGTTLTVRLSRRERITRCGPAGFEWEMTLDAFEESLAKIASLSTQCHACHQYFDCHPADDAVVMMAVGEYDAAWWGRVGG